MTRDGGGGPGVYRAWTWRGGDKPEDLALAQVAMAELAPGDVLVRNAVVGLNPVDYKVLGAPALGWRPGHVPGVDGAGTVIAVGEGVGGGWLGARVAYHQNLFLSGSFADYTIITARALLRLPDTLDFETAAAFPCAGLTAWLALDKLPERRGERLLVSGAGGSVGHWLVQLAVARGFVVTAMCNPRHWERLRALGASAFLPGPLAEGQGWPEDQSHRFFAVIDAVSAAHAARLSPALGAGGHVVCIQGRLADWPCPPFGPAISMHEVALGALHRFGNDRDWSRLTETGQRILADVAAGRLRAESDPVVKNFTDLPHLLDALKHRSFSGKPLIRIN